MTAAWFKKDNLDRQTRRLNVRIKKLRGDYNEVELKGCYSDKELAEKEGAKVVVVSAQVESELVELDDEERRDFLADLGVELESCGLRALVRNAYDLLQLQTYYTSGPTETRAWTIRKGWTAPKAAGVIHNDFERGFIRAETISYEDLVAAGSEANAKAKGLLRSEGKDYVVQEGDIILFRFNV